MVAKHMTRLTLILAGTLLLPASSCDNEKDLRLEAYCDATAADRDRASDAVLAEGTDLVVVNTVPLIAKSDRACAGF